MALEFAVPVTATLVSSHHSSTISQDAQTDTPLSFAYWEQSASPTIVLIPRAAISFDRCGQRGGSQVQAPRSAGQIDRADGTECPASSSGCSDRCDSDASYSTGRTNRVKKESNATFDPHVLR